MILCEELIYVCAIFNEMSEYQSHETVRENTRIMAYMYAFVLEKKLLAVY